MASNKTSIFFYSLVIATVAEFLGLFYWVKVGDNGFLLLGIAIITIGLLAERIAVYLLIHAVWGPAPAHKKLILSLFLAGNGETIAWLIWLFLADGSLGLLWASVLLAVILLFEHSIQFG